MFERYTEPARRSIFFARYEAAAAGSPAIEPAHLILGLLREDRRLAAKIPDLEGLRAELVPAAHTKTAGSVDLPLTGEVKAALSRGAELAISLGHAHIAPPHLLAGLLQVESRETQALAARGVTLESLRQSLADDAKAPGEKPPDRATLHELVDRLPESGMATAAGFLRNLESLMLHGMPAGFRGAGWRPGFGTPAEGRVSTSRKDPDGVMVVESRQLVHGHEILVVERFRVSDDRKKLTYSHEARGPKEQEQRHEFEFEIS